MGSLPVVKCHGTGNDFVLLDEAFAAPDRLADLARRLCDRRFGVGGDGLIVVGPASVAGADVRMRIFNADGSEAETCGNGLRCVARLRFEDSGYRLRVSSIETSAGVVRCEVVGDGGELFVRAGMSVPRAVRPWAAPIEVAGVCARGADVSMGNPHRVAIIDVDPGEIDLDRAARALGADANVEIVHVVGSRLMMRVHERGVGETLACGSGACAAAAAAIALGEMSSPVRVAMPGGEVAVEWPDRESPMTLVGGAAIVFTATVDVPDSMTAAGSASHATGR